MTTGAEYAIRCMTESDFDGLESLVKKEWFSQYGFTDEYASVISEQYVRTYSTRCTSAYAFESEGRPLGYLLGYASGQTLLFPGEVDYSVMGDGPHVDEFLRIMDADARMVERCKGRGFDSELLLFIVDSESRGMKVGSRLLRRFAEDAFSTGHKLMYLFTDDYCNMGFYEHIGCKVAAREKVLSGGSDHTFVMLELNLSEYVGNPESRK